jgi:hypothetical protein
MEKMDSRYKMNLVFGLDGIICSPALNPQDAKPLANVTEFMQWLKGRKYHITIWAERPNTLESKITTERWLKSHQIPYDRLLFDRPEQPIFVDETPPNAKYYQHFGDNSVISMLFEEWIEEIKC